MLLVILEQYPIQVRSYTQKPKPSTKTFHSKLPNPSSTKNTKDRVAIFFVKKKRKRKKKYTLQLLSSILTQQCIRLRRGRRSMTEMNGKTNYEEKTNWDFRYEVWKVSNGEDGRRKVKKRGRHEILVNWIMFVLDYYFRYKIKLFTY